MATTSPHGGLENVLYNSGNVSSSINSMFDSGVHPDRNRAMASSQTRARLLKRPKRLIHILDHMSRFIVTVINMYSTNKKRVTIATNDTATDVL